MATAKKGAEPSFDDLFDMIESAKASGIARRDALEAEIKSATTRKAEAIAEIERNFEAEIGSKHAEMAELNGKLEKLGIRPTVASAEQPTERAGRGEVQRQVLDLMAREARPLTRGQIIELLGAKGNTGRESSLSNALNGLKKGGKLNNRNGAYVLPGSAQSEPAALEQPPENGSVES